MANVIHIRRQPTGLEQAGQSMQELANNFIQHTLAMAQQQNAQNMQLMGLGMQERRLADANARDDRRWKEQTAMQERRFAQEDKWRQAQLDLQKQQLGRSLAAMDKPQLTQVEGPYGNKISVWVNPRTQQITPASIPGLDGGSGVGIPGLDGAFNAAMNEVEQPGFGTVGEGMAAPAGGEQPLSPAIRRSIDILYPHLAEGGSAANQPAEAQAPSLASSHTTDPLARAFDLLGVKFPQSAQPQQVEATPEAPAQDAQMPTTFAPGTVVDGSGNPVQLPANVPWGKQEKQYVGGKEYYGTRTPNGLYFKIGGEVPLTTAERKEQKELEKIGRAESDAQVGASNVIDAINKARALAGRGNFGFMPVTGAGSLLNWIPGTTGRDLEGQLDTIKANMGFDKLQQMRANSPTGGALGAVSDFENKMLQATIANLETSQSHEQFMENLQRVEDTYNRIVHGPNYRKQPQANGPSAQLPAGFRLVN